jgi:hypothetical protein
MNLTALQGNWEVFGMREWIALLPTQGRELGEECETASATQCCGYQRTWDVEKRERDKT